MEKLRLSILPAVSFTRLALLAGLVALLLSAGGCDGRDGSAAAPESAGDAPSVQTEPTDAGTDTCRAKPPPDPVACTMEWAPVCGCDSRTYGNACQARAAGITRFTPGECEDANLD